MGRDAQPLYSIRREGDERFMRRYAGKTLILLGLAVIANAAMAAPRNAPPPPPPPPVDQNALSGSWIGTWTGGSFVYEAIMALNVDPTGNIAGTISWTLRATPSNSGKDKIGLRAIEYVRGKYYPETEAVVLDGYRKDDPNNIWESDKYRLILAPTHQTMGGITGEHDSWAGQFFLHRESAGTQ
jgi:hypothetical protein